MNNGANVTLWSDRGMYINMMKKRVAIVGKRRGGREWEVS